jgi:hypothetical protein
MRLRPRQLRLRPAPRRPKDSCRRLQPLHPLGDQEGVATLEPHQHRRHSVRPPSHARSATATEITSIIRTELTRDWPGAGRQGVTEGRAGVEDPPDAIARSQRADDADRGQKSRSVNAASSASSTRTRVPISNPSCAALAAVGSCEARRRTRRTVPVETRPSTRPVMPTLIAVGAARRRIAVSDDQPIAIPATDGTTTPITATSIDARPTRPTRPSSARSVSTPTCTSSRSTPISMMIWRLTPRDASSCASPRADGPIVTPATISRAPPGSPVAQPLRLRPMQPRSRGRATVGRGRLTRQQQRRQPTLNRIAAAAATASELSRHPRRRTVTIAPGPSTRRRVTSTCSHRRGLSSSRPASRRNADRSITLPPCFTRTSSTARSRAPR